MEPDEPTFAAISPPKTFSDLKTLLASGEIKLPKRLQQVAAFALAQPDEIALCTVAKIAEDAKVQPSALVRFGQALGFTGFTDLQVLFRDRLRSQVSSYDERLIGLRAVRADGSGTATFLDGFCAASAMSVARLHDGVDLQAIDEAARRLADAETIYLVGQRRSFPVTSYASYALGSLGIRNVLIGSALGTDAETVSFATDRDAALAVSFTPYAADTVAHARRLHAAGVPLIVITDSPFSPLCASADMWFEVVEADFRGFRSLSASLALSTTLLVAIAELRKSQG